jgi:predicted acetyltransferase
MNLQVAQANEVEKPVLRRLLELYLHDLSEFDGRDVDSHGAFGYRYLDHYWREEGRHPFLVRVDGALAGFVLVDTRCERDESDFEVAEFFIMKRYRRRRIGKMVAFHVFDLFPGVWEISQLPANLPARTFWRKVVRKYARGNFKEFVGQNGGPLLVFDNTDSGE